jgi:tetratricopeptide (TPR) repeat protein
LPERAIFIMVTAERAYEKVISVVELAPDDYVLKPFAPEVLRQRLEKVIQKKKAFERFFTLRERARYGEAIAELDHMLSQRANAPYRYDILRSRAVLLLDSGALESAAAAYEAIIAEHPFPWAKAGLARAHHRSLRHDEARAMVDQVIEQVPNYLEAYDLKAEICTRQGAFEEALRTLDAAAKRTPFNLERKKSLSLAAGRAGNFELARALMDEVVRNDVLGDHSAAYLALARCALNESDHLQARALLARATPRDGRYADEEANLSLECMAAVTDELRGDERFDRIRAQIVQRKQFSVNAAIDITRVALHFSDLQLANLVAERTLTGPDARQAFAELLTIYRHENLEQPFRELQREIVSRKVIHHDQPGGLR